MDHFHLPKNSTLTLKQSYQCHGGRLGYFEHESSVTRTTMAFTLFLPPSTSQNSKTPLLTFLSGLTCTADNFTTKGQAYSKAAELGVAVLAPDTSPRGDSVPNDDAYDLGQGAGFYIDATQQPWAQHFAMESYILKDLIPLIENTFKIGGEKARGLTGHSMGGHGALTFFLKYPDFFTSCSAFAPTVAPSQVPWGIKAFTHYLGNDTSVFQQHDACELVSKAVDAQNNAPILIDQGLADTFLERELQPHRFEKACKESGQALTLRMQQGYDHSYFFIQSFIAEHLEWHSLRLSR